MRLFVAINFPDTITRAIAEALREFPVSDPPWRWAAAPTWHLTLKFIGDAAPESVQGITGALARVAEGARAFPARLGPFGGFPNLARPRVLFYALDRGVEAAAGLAGAVDAALVDAVGLEAERRPFHAHVTVARIKRPLPPAVTRKLRAVPPLEGGDFEAFSIDLMRSHLGPQGARYERVKQFALPQAK